MGVGGARLLAETARNIQVVDLAIVQRCVRSVTRAVAGLTGNPLHFAEADGVREFSIFRQSEVNEFYAGHDVQQEIPIDNVVSDRF